VDAQKPPERQLLSRTDLDNDAKRTYARSTLQNMARVIRTWTSFIEQRLGKSVGDPEHSLQCFKKGGILPDRVLLRRYLLWYTDSGVGRLKTRDWESTASVTSLSLNTVHWYWLKTSFYYFNKKLDAELTTDTRVWIQNDLANEANLELGARVKPLAYAEDATTVVRSLLDGEFQWCFRTLRQLLYFLVSMNLLIDTSGRVGELCLSSQDPNHVTHWEDVEFYVFPPKEEGGSNEVWALFTSRYTKGRKRKPSEYQKTVLHFLPTEWAFEDGCRLLLILALVEGHLDGVDMWADIMASSPDPDGSQIYIKAS
jgi:hypothetical protein